MAKNSNTAAVEATTTKVEVANVKSFVIPVDGSKGAEFIKSNGGVSKAIRALTAQGYSRGEVAKMLDKRYQHVRNVLITPVKKTQEETASA